MTHVEELTDWIKDCIAGDKRIRKSQEQRHEWSAAHDCTVEIRVMKSILTRIDEVWAQPDHEIDKIYRRIVLERDALITAANLGDTTSVAKVDAYNTTLNILLRRE